MRLVNRKTIFVKLLVIVFFGALAATGFLGWLQKIDASAFGPSASHTDAPGEDNCTACHASFPVNSGTGSVQITGIPRRYMPGQQVSVTVTTSQSDATIYGFQLTAIDSLGRNAGTITLPVQTLPRTQIISGLVGGDVRQYVEHTVDGLSGGVFGSNSWNFTWTAPLQRVGKISFYASGNAANSDGSPSDDYIYTVSKETVPAIPVFDYDGDGKTDVSIFRPGPGEWWYRRSGDGVAPAFQFGQTTDKITPGDFTGDGKTDIAFWRPATGFWFVLRSEDSAFFAFPFGSNGDIPAPADYDGDGKTDAAVYRPGTREWFVLRSSDQQVTFTTFGAPQDKPAVADFDGDGKADISVWKPKTTCGKK